MECYSFATATKGVVLYLPKNKSIPTSSEPLSYFNYNIYSTKYVHYKYISYLVMCVYGNIKFVSLIKLKTI